LIAPIKVIFRGKFIFFIFSRKVQLLPFCPHHDESSEVIRKRERNGASLVVSG